MGWVSGADFGCVNARVARVWWGRRAGLGGVVFIRFDYVGGGGKRQVGRGWRVGIGGGLVVWNEWAAGIG